MKGYINFSNATKEETMEKIKLAVNGGIGFGSKLTAKQLLTLANYLGEDEVLELTTFQQLYIEIPVNQKDEIIKELQQVGLSCYPVGNYIKSLRTCNFCKGAEEEGMPVAIEINRRIAGIPVPFTLKAAYTGCTNACGEPLLSDIGVVKVRDHYNLYIGGTAKGIAPKVGTLFKENLTPDQLYETIDLLIKEYQTHGKKREPFHKFVNRVDLNENEKIERI